jgi:hypothetical protein
LVSFSRLTVDIEGRIGDVIKKADKFYCIVESSNPFSSQSFKHLYILSSSGETLNKLQVPYDVNATYYDLHLRYDSILMKNYMGGGTFYFDESNLKWTSVADADDVVYEDSLFYVNFLNFGEWGSTAWFRDRETGLEYTIPTTAPTVNKLDSAYIVTGNQSVYRVPDPRELALCDSTQTYDSIAKSRQHFWLSERQENTGYETLYHDTTYWDEVKVSIWTSFISGDSLVLVFNDSIGVHLGSIENGTIHKQRTLGEGLRASGRSFNYRNGLPSSQLQIHSLYDKSNNVYGLLCIEYGKIKVIELENRDKANILGSEKANEEVAGFVNWNVSNSSSLLLTDVEQRMKTLLGRDVSPQHKVSIGEGLYPNKNGFDLETPRAYKIIEDSLITLVVDFYYTKQDESVKVSSYEWVQTNEWFYSLPKEKNKELVRKKFEARLFSDSGIYQSRFWRA